MATKSKEKRTCRLQMSNSLFHDFKREILGIVPDRKTDEDYYAEWRNVARAVKRAKCNKNGGACFMPYHDLMRTVVKDWLDALEEQRHRSGVGASTKAARARLDNLKCGVPTRSGYKYRPARDARVRYNARKGSSLAGRRKRRS